MPPRTAPLNSEACAQAHPSVPAVTGGPATATQAVQAAVGTVLGRPPPAAVSKKCEAKCGFFAMAGGSFCSKCQTKREVEWSSWHGVLSKKRGAID